MQHLRDTATTISSSTTFYSSRFGFTSVCISITYTIASARTNAQNTAGHQTRTYSSITGCAIFAAGQADRSIARDNSSHCLVIIGSPCPATFYCKHSTHTANLPGQ
ncbi:MAG TPA: hypothetical protein VGT44_02790 [Ktedonobacteraceae bacterium]|nr:hypothetical protein [Ktedonobacteraceae bacterium]